MVEFLGHRRAWITHHKDNVRKGLLDKHTVRGNLLLRH